MVKTKFAVIMQRRGKGYAAYAPELYGCEASAGNVGELLKRVRKSIRCYPKTYEDLSADFIGIRAVNYKGKTFYAAIERCKDGYYVVSVPSLAGCFTQARTMDKLMANIMDVLKLCLHGNKLPKGDDLVGVQIIEV